MTLVMSRATAKRGAVRWVPLPKGFLAAWKVYDNGRPFSFESVKGRCAEVADVYARWRQRHGLTPAVARYGFYLGTVDHPWWGNQSMYRHAWTVVEGEIHDPTLFAFAKRAKPALGISAVDSPFYDVGMNRTKRVIFGEAPIPAIGDGHNDRFREVVPCDQPDINALFDGVVTRQRIFWLANLSPESGHFADEPQRVRMYQWLQDNDYGAFIPRDNQV